MTFENTILLPSIKIYNVLLISVKVEIFDDVNAKNKSSKGLAIVPSHSFNYPIREEHRSDFG